MTKPQMPHVENVEDYFKTIKRTAQLSAMYPVFKPGRFVQIFNILYYILIDLVVLHMAALLVWNLATNTQGDISKIAFLLSNLFPHANAVNFLCYFQLRTGLVDYVFRLAQENFHYSSAPGPAIQSMKKSLKVANYLVISLTVTTAITAHQWTVVPLFTSGVNGSRLLPVPLEYPFEVQRSPRYEIAYVLQAIAQMFMSMQYGGIASLYATLAILIGNQFDVLCCSVRNASLARLPAVADTSSGGEETGEYSRQQEISLYGSEEEYIEDLQRCVRHHLALKRLCRRMDQLFKPMLLSMLIGIMLMMCMSLYSKFELPSLEYTLICLLHLTVFCFFGQHISNKSTTVSAAAWSNVWWLRGREGRRTNALLMQHSQRPIVLTAGGIFPLNLATFVDMVKASFSFLTLLRNLKAKQY